MPKTTVFIASKTEQENYLLQKKLEPLELEFTDIKFAGVHIAGLLNAVDLLTSAVIVNVNEWSAKETAILQDLRSAGKLAPILLAAKPDTTGALEFARAIRDVTILPKPFETKDLSGLVRKMLLARNISQQVHRRFPTAQDAEVEAGGKTFMTRVCNLSKGGALLEFLTPSDLKNGESLKLKLELKDLNRTYTFPAKIVWMNANGGARGVGVEFTGMGEVQRSTIGF